MIPESYDFSMSSAFRTFGQPSTRNALLNENWRGCQGWKGMRRSIVVAQFLQIVALQSRFQNTVPNVLDVSGGKRLVLGSQVEDEIIGVGDVAACGCPGKDCEIVQGLIDRPGRRGDFDVRRFF